MMANEIIKKYKTEDEKLSALRLKRLRQGVKKAKSQFEYLALYELISLIMRHYPEDKKSLESLLSSIKSKISSID